MIKPLFVLFLSICCLSPNYGQSVLNRSSAKASCCGGGNSGVVPCNPLPLLQVGHTYLIYVHFTLKGSRSQNADFISFDLDILKPNFGSASLTGSTYSDSTIVPDSLKFYTVQNGNLGNPVTNFISLPRGATKEFVAFTYFKFAENVSNIDVGTYTFKVHADGFMSNNNGAIGGGTPFSNTSNSYFEVVFDDPGAPCTDTPLEDISNNPLRTSLSPTLAPKWHPNPTQNSAILELDLDKESKVDVEIMDMQGRVIMRPPFDQNLKSGMNRRKLDVSQLAAGIYYSRITTETETQVIKWVKLE